MARIAGIDLPKDKRVEIGLTYIYGIGRKSANDILKDITADFKSSFADSHRITLSDYKKINILKRFAGRVLRIFAPLV